jgi:predicted signal transduction protein with EAL and GGDEF domain
MARELNLKVVAEGVETMAELGFLRRHRCDQAQGFLISRAVPVPEIEALLRRGIPSVGAAAKVAPSADSPIAQAFRRGLA